MIPTFRGRGRIRCPRTSGISAEPPWPRPSSGNGNGTGIPCSRIHPGTFIPREHRAVPGMCPNGSIPGGNSSWNPEPQDTGKGRRWTMPHSHGSLLWNSHPEWAAWGCFILGLRKDNLFIKSWVQWEYHLSASGTVNCHVSLLAETTNGTKSAPDLYHSKLILFFVSITGYRGTAKKPFWKKS